MQRSQRVQIDAPLDGAEGVEIDLADGVGDGGRSRRADAAHVGDRRVVLGDDWHHPGHGRQRSGDSVVRRGEGRRGIPERLRGGLELARL